MKSFMYFPKVGLQGKTETAWLTISWALPHPFLGFLSPPTLPPPLKNTHPKVKKQPRSVLTFSFRNLRKWNEMWERPHSVIVIFSVHLSGLCTKVLCCCDDFVVVTEECFEFDVNVSWKLCSETMLFEPYKDFKRKKCICDFSVKLYRNFLFRWFYPSIFFTIMDIVTVESHNNVEVRVRLLSHMP